MPIHCPIPIKCLDQKPFGQRIYSILPYFFASQNELGNLADESVYQADVAARLTAAGYVIEQEVPVTAEFDSFRKTYYVDLVVNESVVIELKTVKSLVPEHDSQLLNYLLLLNIEHGQLVNMRTTSVQTKFINAVTSKQNTRCQFSLNTDEWNGNTTTMNWIVDLLRNWGTGLELPLYHQAIVHFLGGELNVIKEFPIERSGISLGNQRFYMMDDCSSFRLTAFESPQPHYRQQLVPLIKFSPLQAIHWINIAHEKVTFTTVI